MSRFLFLLLFFSISSLALDLDRESINVSYMRLPTHPIVNENQRFYSAEFIDDFENGEFQQVIDENFHIKGLQQDSDKAVIHIEFLFDNISVTSSEVTYSKKKNQGSQGETIYDEYYTPTFKYKTHAEVTVKNHNGKSKTYKFGSRLNTYKAPYSYTENDANMYFHDGLDQDLHEIQKSFIITTCRELSDTLTKKYGYEAVKEQDYLLILDSRFNSDYKDYKRYYELAKNLFVQMSAFEKIDPLKSKMQGFLHFLQAIPERYKEDKKADKKMRYAAYYNLAKIYYYFEEFEQSIHYYQKVIENDYHEGQSKRNINDIKDLQVKMALNQVYSRHFSMNLKKSQPQTAQLAQTVNNQNHSGSVQYLYAEISTFSGEILEGKIELPEDINDPVSELQNSESVTIKFLNDNDEIETKSIFTDDIESIRMDNEALKRIHFKSASENSSAPVREGKVNKGTLISALAQELFQSSVVSLYKYDGELILQKSSDNTGISTSTVSFSFAFKKKLRQYFSECSQMTESINSGQFSNDEQGLMNAVRMYTDCKH